MYELPKLSYDYNALEPYIDAQTMEIHHSKHHQAYVNKLNAALEKFPQEAEKPLEVLLGDLKLIPDEIRSAIQNHGGGHWNHSFFWEVLGPPQAGNKGGEPWGELFGKLEDTFGGFGKFQAAFEDEATKRFGSGWAWLVLDDSQKLKVYSTANQDCPLSQEYTPLIGLDVWEHAYYLKYQNRRGDYLKNFWKVVNWAKVVSHYNAASKDDKKEKKEEKK